MNKLYSFGHYNFIDQIILKKRKEIVKIINSFISKYKVFDALDIGTTSDKLNKSSNYLIKNLSDIKIYKSISNQNFKNKFFSKILNKSITKNYSKKEINIYKSDLVISNATIEHVGSLENQIRMIKNIVKLSKKIFIIITPNRYHPIDFHTKLPFIHWLPKSIHRKILNFLGFKKLSKEENLNLLSEMDMKKIFKKSKVKKFKIFNIYFFGFKSNLIFLGIKS